MKRSYTTYTEEIANKICDIIATTNLGLQAICSGEGMPARSTVYWWLQCKPEFERKYALAKELQADLLLEQMLAISDDESHDTIEVAWYNTTVAVPNAANVSRAKLKIETRKWMLARLAPKKYADAPAPNGDNVRPTIPGEFHKINLID